jgi:hypothetical protein
MRLVAIILSAFLLIGCWSGEALYSDADAVPALEPGVYEMTAGEEHQSVTVSILPTGVTQFEDKGGKASYGFFPLGQGSRRTFVAWYKGEDESGSREQFYSLVERQPDGVIIFYQPTCDGDEAAIARAAGAQIQNGMVPTCRFPSRVSLESAMRQLRPRDFGASMKLVRVGDR